MDKTFKEGIKKNLVKRAKEVSLEELPQLVREWISALDGKVSLKLGFDLKRYVDGRGQSLNRYCRVLSKKWITAENVIYDSRASAMREAISNCFEDVRYLFGDGFRFEPVGKGEPPSSYKVSLS